MKLLSRFWPIVIIILTVLIFFKPVILENKLPIPADTIVGLYHPWRDFYVQDYPRGIPFKNFLITDPVRQQYVWRSLAIEQIKNRQLPLWNPYNFSGNPLLANFQTAAFYPLNILFLILPFNLAWSLLIVLEPLAAGLFLYFYLQKMKLTREASLLGGIVFAFSGFGIAWLEWNTIIHVALWLPLILLAKEHLLEKISFKWVFVLIFAECSQILAGHLQILFYALITSNIYLIVRIIQLSFDKRNIAQNILSAFKKYLPFLAIGIVVFTATSVQWLPSLQFILNSARGGFDQPNWRVPGWFIPWQNLIQFIAPDFFGNPATLNYWGEWNYGEFIGYIGILPLIFSLMAVFWRKDKKTYFFSGIVLMSLIFALPTVLAKIPYQLATPFISTSQPTRLLFLVDFSLAVLVALGFDWFIKRLHDSNQLTIVRCSSNQVSKIFKTVLLVGAVFAVLWLFVIFGNAWWKIITPDNLAVAERNLLLPTSLFLISSILLLLLARIRRKTLISLMIYIILLDMIFDLFRFGWKFTPFTSQEWLFPQTKTINFLQQQKGPFRVMATDNRIFPPNFSTFYRLEDISGYDPLYLKNYGQLVAAWYRDKPDISPMTFNRILTPQNYSSKLADLLNVKYVLSLKEEISPKLKLVFQEGQTRVYENKTVLPRAFLVKEVKWVDNEQQAMDKLWENDFSPRETAVIEKPKYLVGDGVNHDNQSLSLPDDTVEIVSYTESKIILKVNRSIKNINPGFLVLSDNFYPSWRVRVYSLNDHYDWDNIIYKADFNLRGVFVPNGENTVEFYNSFL